MAVPRLAVLVLLLCSGLLYGCSGSAPRPSAPVLPALSPSVDAALMVHEVSPEESLSVRLLGAIGPSGAYSLQGIEVTTVGRDVYIVPTVARAADGNFIQMVIPLDHTVKLSLSKGRWTIHVLTTAGDRSESVFVSKSARLVRPTTQVEVGDPFEQSGGRAVRLQIRGECPDGFVERIEVRTVVDHKASTWQVAEEVRREGSSLICMAVVQQQGGETVFEARAMTGQGFIDRSSATITLR